VTGHNNCTSIFYKNNYEVEPNPGAIFGENMPVLYFYFEMYNLYTGSGAINISHKVYNSRNQISYEKRKYVSRDFPSIVEVGAVNISSFPSGAYSLVIIASDSGKNISVSSMKRFFVYNRDILDTSAYTAAGNDFLPTELAVMSQEELDELFESSRYIASGNETDKWKKLTDIDGKRKFLAEFWQMRDQFPETPQNETKSEYLRRVQYTNEKFPNIFQKKGYKTDKGRIYILYGEPSEIERYPNEVDSKPYGIWRFDEMEGGVIFVFADYSGFNDYRLIHSTKRGELSDPKWKDKIAIIP